ncbi:DUF3180 domain-containing protein [Rhodococcus aerolatus]
MTPTRPRDLVGLGLLVAVCVWLVVRSVYGSMPPLPRYAGLSLALLALVEIQLGRVVRARVQRKAGAGLLDPLMAARALALAKASSLVGAGLAGAWAGYGAHLLGVRGQLAAAADETPGAAIGLVCALALVGAGLFLEHCCRTPDDPPGAPPA